jgi:hypothetical protein
MQANGITPGMLGGIQRLVDSGQKPGFATHPMPLPQTHAYRDMQQLAACQHGCGRNGLPQGLTQGQGLLQATARQQDGKLLATHAAHQIIPPHPRCNSRASARSTWSPASWPWLSLMRLKWSISSMARQKGRRSR